MGGYAGTIDMPKLHKYAEGLYCFHCPGCKYDHPFHVAPEKSWSGAQWEWNGDMEKPTFKPSLLVFKDVPSRRCHSFVTDGRIQFLSDCWHKMAGMTVEIPEWFD
jgi:hypothetical protein